MHKSTLNSIAKRLACRPSALLTKPSQDALKACLLRVIFLSFSFIFSLSVNANNNVDLVAMHFYEGKQNTQIPDWDSPKISTQFTQKSTRFVFALIRLNNNLWLQADQVLELEVRFINFDGTEVGRQTIHTPLNTKQETIELHAGLGWEASGQWKPGFYRAELWSDEQIKLGQSRFAIEGEVKVGPAATIPRAIEVERIGFFEADQNGLDQAPENWTDGRIRNNFHQSLTRHVFTMFNLKNSGKSDITKNLKFELRYYQPNGELYASPVIDYKITEDWNTARLWNGWGWSEPGKWPAGRYRVELWLNSQTQLSESHFTIHD